MIDLDLEFAEDCTATARNIKRLAKVTVENLEKRMELVVEMWKSEVIRRIPRDEGWLANRINSRVYRIGDVVLGEVGTEVAYAVFLEFGTRFIAAGAVWDLGQDPGITDAQSIKHWPAKDADALGGNREQMPFLRPAFNAIRDQVIAILLGELR